jgi:hypothetical protein
VLIVVGIGGHDCAPLGRNNFTHSLGKLSYIAVCIAAKTLPETGLTVPAPGRMVVIVKRATPSQFAIRMLGEVINVLSKQVIVAIMMRISGWHHFLPLIHPAHKGSNKLLDHVSTVVYRSECICAEGLYAVGEQLGCLAYNSIEVSPQLCWGDSQRLTYAGRWDFPLVPPKAQRKGSHDAGLPTLTAHTLGMQISPRLYPEVAEKGLVHGPAQRTGAGVSGPSAAEGGSKWRRGI